MHPIHDFFKAITTRGTAACAVFYGALGLLLGKLLVSFGFWRTLLMVVLCAAGAIIGKVTKVSEGAKTFINKQFPPKPTTPVQFPTKEAAEVKAEVEAALQVEDEGKEEPETPAK